MLINERKIDDEESEREEGKFLVSFFLLAIKPATIITNSRLIMYVNVRGKIHSDIVVWTKPTKQSENVQIIFWWSHVEIARRHDVEHSRPSCVRGQPKAPERRHKTKWNLCKRIPKRSIISFYHTNSSRKISISFDRCFVVLTFGHFDVPRRFRRFIVTFRVILTLT